ncbi:MAG: Gldg family protein [Planctomycetota bacterium]
MSGWQEILDFVFRILTLRFFEFLSPAWIVFLGVRLIGLALAMGWFASAQMRRECLSLAVAPATYIVATLFVLIISLVFYLAPLESPVVSLEPVAVYVKFLGLFFVPLLTMRLIAEERRLGTLELLLTAPVSLWEVVLAKFAAAFLFYAIMILPCAVYVGLHMWMGDIDSGKVVTVLLGLLLLGGAYVAVGLFASALTRSQVAAAMGGMAMLLCLWLVWYLGGDETLLARTCRALSFKEHFDSSFTKGVVDTGDVVYFASLIGFFLFWAWSVLRVGEDLGSLGGEAGAARQLAAGVAAVVSVEALLAAAAQIHIEQRSLGDIFRPGQGESDPERFWILVSLGVGLAAGGAALFLVRRFFLEKARKLLGNRWATGTLAGGAAMTILFINLNVFAAWHAWREDLSEERLYTLSVPTRRALDKLEEPVYFHVFFTSQDRYDGYPLLEATRSLLQEYTAYSPRVRVEYIDPDASLWRARALAREKNLDLEKLPMLIYVEHRGRRAILPWDYIAQEEVNPFGRRTRLFRGEVAFTSVINRLNDIRTPHVYFTTEHGEYDPFSLARVDRNLGDFTSLLRQEGYDVRLLPLLGGKGVPADCDVLVMVGPSLPFGSLERESLQRYVEAGGHGLFLLDPLMRPGLWLGIEEMFVRWGAVLQDDLLFDVRNNQGGEEGNLLVMASGDHPLTRIGRVSYGYLRQGRSIEVRSGGAAGEDWSAQYLLATFPTAVAVANSPQGGEGSARNRQGSVPCAVALEGPRNARVVLVGDADLAGNLDLAKAQNQAFLLSSVQWLLGRDRAVDIPSRADKSRSIAYTALERRVSFWVAVVALPQLFLLAAVLVWWLRKE